MLFKSDAVFINCETCGARRIVEGNVGDVVTCPCCNSKTKIHGMVVDGYDGVNSDFLIERAGWNTDNGFILKRYTGSAKKVVVPDFVTEIGTSAFASEKCGKVMEEVILPEGVERIGNQAFFGCEQLKKINIPNTLRFIGEMAFSECPSLIGVSVPVNVRVGFMAFRNADKLAADWARRGLCPLCGYKISGLFSKSCDRCGASFSSREIKDYISKG